MPLNNHEYFQILPFIILGIGIVISVIIEISTKKSEEILPWFSMLLFLGVADTCIRAYAVRANEYSLLRRYPKSFIANQGMSSWISL